MALIVAVIGVGRKSGKTVAVEALVRELSKKYKVGTIKQIHNKSFSIDTKGKDTWRHAEAGATAVASASPREVAVIKRIKGKDRFREAMRLLGVEKLDVVIVEGNPKVNPFYILAGREPKEISALIKKAGENALCVSSLTPAKFKGSELKLPIFNPVKEAGKMAALVKKYL